MPSFSDSFWTPDFSSGVDIVFSKLNQGCVENQEFIELFTSRMECEEDYGKKLSLLPGNHTPNKNGFDRDDGASLKNAFKGVSNEMGDEGKHHLTVAANIRDLVVDPFSKWSADHKQRIQYSDSVLRNSLKIYKTKYKQLEKIQRKYYNKCRTLETIKKDMTEEEIIKELSLQEEESASSGPNGKSVTRASTMASEDSVASARSGESGADQQSAEDYESIVKLGGNEYGKHDLKELFHKMLGEIPKKSHKVPIFGVYENVSTGSSITKWLQENLGISNIDKVEQFGQDLISNGYLKKINTSVVPTGGQTFVNSSTFFYQWKPASFRIAEIKPNERQILGGDYDDGSNDIVSPLSTRTVSTYFVDLKSSFEEPTLKKINREVQELDESYKREVKKIDRLRCDLEELIIDHLTFMEKCELDRLKALKKVIANFQVSVSSNIGILQNINEKIAIYEESISPDKDLQFLISNYRTGPFNPRVPLYDNYYDSFKDQIFGVDLETRCKNDNKTVPLIVSSILQSMDRIYPDLADDEARVNIWLIPVALKETHALRRELEENASAGTPASYLQTFENYKTKPEVIASVLKLYLLELPDSLVSSNEYSLIKSIYNQFSTSNNNNNDNSSNSDVNSISDDNSTERINGLISVLKDLDRTNLSTLNAISTHFHRLIDILSNPKDPKSNNQLAKQFHLDISYEFSNCVLRPKSSKKVNFEDKHHFKFLYDLLKYKVDVFKALKTQLKRNNTTGSTPNVNSRNVSRNGSLQHQKNELTRSKSALESRLEQAVKASVRPASSPHIPNDAAQENTNPTKVNEVVKEEEAKEVEA